MGVRVSFFGSSYLILEESKLGTEKISWWFLFSAINSGRVFVPHLFYADTSVVFAKHKVTVLFEK